MQHLHEPMTQNRPSQSQSVTNNTIANSQVQIAQAEGSVSQKSNYCTSGISATKTIEDFSKAIEDISALLKQSGLSEEEKKGLSDYLNAAKKEMEKPDPNKKIIAVNLDALSQNIQKTNKAVGATQELWNNIKALITNIGPWLGSAASLLNL